jgi:hypothetical protein
MFVDRLTKPSGSCGVLNLLIRVAQEPGQLGGVIQGPARKQLIVFPSHTW